MSSIQSMLRPVSTVPSSATYSARVHALAGSARDVQSPGVIATTLRRSNHLIVFSPPFEGDHWHAMATLVPPLLRGACPLCRRPPQGWLLCLLPLQAGPFQPLHVRGREFRPIDLVGDLGDRAF